MILLIARIVNIFSNTPRCENDGPEVDEDGPAVVEQRDQPSPLHSRSPPCIFQWPHLYFVMRDARESSHRPSRLLLFRLRSNFGNDGQIVILVDSMH